MLLALVPVVAISPILLYIGMLIGAQAFQTTPLKHAPAIVLALTPHLAAWAKLQVDTMLGSTLDAAEKVGAMAPDKVAAVKQAALASLPQQGVLYHGLEVMGGGSILAGLVLGAIGVFVIEREFSKAAAFAFAGAVLTYFGFMHGEAVGIWRRIGRDARRRSGICCGCCRMISHARTSDGNLHREEIGVALFEREEFGPAKAGYPAPFGLGKPDAHT